MTNEDMATELMWPADPCFAGAAALREPDPASVESALSAVSRDDAERAIERLHGPTKPDPRDEALEAAQKIFKRITADIAQVRRIVDQQWVDRNDCVKITSQTRITYGDVIEMDDALAAIARAKGGPRE